MGMTAEQKEEFESVMAFDNQNKIAELVAELGKKTNDNKALYATYKESKDEEDKIRLTLTERLKGTGLLTAKTPEYTASIAVKQQVAVTNEREAIDWLKNSGLETDQYIGLKTTNFKTMATSMLKDTGEVIPGTQLVESESLSIRANKKKA
jgi:hypothetical protein